MTRDERGRLVCVRCGETATKGTMKNPLCVKCWSKCPVMVKERTPFSRHPENFINSFRTFKRHDVEKFSDEWFAAEMRKVNPRGTICETHRRLYMAILRLPDGNGKDELIAITKRAYLLGNKIVKKLKEYKEAGETAGDKGTFQKPAKAYVRIRHRNRRQVFAMLEAIMDGSLVADSYMLPKAGYERLKGEMLE